MAEKYPYLIEEIYLDGQDIGSHGFNHKLLCEQTRLEIEYDLLRSIEEIHKASGFFSTKYRAPGFSIFKENINILKLISNAGFLIDCSLFASKRAQG